jgi:hypothetical protein
MSDVRSDDHARHAPESPGVTSRCANCGTPVPLAFCPACGQPRSTDPPTVAEFVAEAVRHVLSLESKGWRTVRALLFRPGALTAEYLAGRRVPYVEPLRLFLWISVLVIAAATAFDLHLGLRIPGDAGPFFLDPDPARTGPAAGSRRFTPMRLVLEHTELGRRAAAPGAGECAAARRRRAHRVSGRVAVSRRAARLRRLVDGRARARRAAARSTSRRSSRAGSCSCTRSSRAADRGSVPTRAPVPRARP